MSVWNKARHDGARNILVRLGKAGRQRRGGHRHGSPLLVHPVPAQRLRIRPGGQDMHFEDSGANGFELPGAAPSADTAFKDVAYEVTIVATHTFNNGQHGHSIATRVPVRGRKPRRATAHQPRHQVRGAGLRIVRLDGPHSAESTCIAIQ
jgi:hypothetical protein